MALSNVFTCKLLLRSAVSTGTCDYEGLAAAVGGPWLKVGLSSLVLIRGTPLQGNIAGICGRSLCAGSGEYGGLAAVVGGPWLEMSRWVQLALLNVDKHCKS